MPVVELLGLDRGEVDDRAVGALTIRTARSRCSGGYFEGRAMTVILPRNPASGHTGVIHRRSRVLADCGRMGSLGIAGPDGSCSEIRVYSRFNV